MAGNGLGNRIHWQFNVGGINAMYLGKLKLNGRTAVVTGGGRAIGLAICEALAEAGADVIIADRDARVAAEGQQALGAKGYAADVVTLDVSDAASVTAAADRLAATGTTVDILVCNAGIVHSEVAAEDMTDTQWTESHQRQPEWRVLVLPSFPAAHAEGEAGCHRERRLDVRVHRQQAAGPGVVQRIKGRRASFDEVARCRMGEPRRPGWSASLAPTYIATPLNEFVKSKPAMYDAWIAGTPMARMGTVDEIASVVHFLASDAASLMTGSVVVVDGGYTCW